MEKIEKFFKLKERGTSVRTELVAGLTSIFCGTAFFIAMFLSPISQLIPGCTTAATLIYVSFLMMGISFGLISYIVISVFCGDIKKIKGSS